MREFLTVGAVSLALLTGCGGGGGESSSEPGPRDDDPAQVIWQEIVDECYVEVVNDRLGVLRHLSRNETLVDVPPSLQEDMLRQTVNCRFRKLREDRAELPFDREKGLPYYLANPTSVSDNVADDIVSSCESDPSVELPAVCDRLRDLANQR